MQAGENMISKKTITGWTSLFIMVFVLLSASAVLADGEIPQRSDIDDKYKWKVEDIYPDTLAWQKDFDYVKANLDILEQYKGHLGDSPQTLLECFKTKEEIEKKIENLYVYAFLKLDEDNRISVYQELGGRISGLYSQWGAKTAFMTPEITAISGETMADFLKKSPELDEYRFYLEDIQRTKAHILSEDEEKILALMGPVAGTASNVFNMIENADLKLGTIIDDDGNPLDLTWGRYSRIMEEGSREVRKAAMDTVEAAYVSHINGLAATLGGSIKKDWAFAQARGYETCLDMSLDNNNIPTSVYHNLIQAVNDNIDVLHKYTALRKKVLGVDTLYKYDMSVPLGPKSSKEYSYEDAMDLLTHGLKPMGDDYLKDLKTALGSGWVDVYETEGKGSGAYSWGTYSSHPYVLLNFTGRLEDVFTLAHEMGHAMNSFYTNQHEAYINGGHSLFTAEVASTCNEAVLMKYLLANTTDKNEKMALLDYYIKQIQGTFFTQVMFAEFELAIHDHIQAGGATSVDYFRKTYRGIYEKYYGPDLEVGEMYDQSGMKISHFYRQYYVYQYATCYAAAQNISSRILAGDDGVLEQYQRFLNTGTSQYPVDILKEAGVDLTQPEAVQATIDLFSSLVDEMSRLLDES